MADSESPIAFSRTGNTGPLGKLDRERKTHLDEETDNKLLQLAARMDMTPGELLREWTCLMVHGLTFTEMLAKHRREQMQREGLDQGRGRAAS